MANQPEIRVFDYVNHPYETVAGVLTESPLGTFQAATIASAARAQSVAAELRVNIAGLDVGTGISILVDGIKSRPQEGTTPPSTVIELKWEAAKSPRLFPLMRAELSLYPLTASETQLDLLGHYQPPLGAVGKVLDAVAGRRIAEASVHRFIMNVAEYLRNSLSNPR